MPAILKRVARLVSNGYFWWLDYIYAGFWQFLGLLRRGNAEKLRSGVGGGKPPVIIIPGIYERWEFMNPVVRVVAQQGHPVHVIEGLGYNRGTVEEMAAEVRKYVNERKLRGCIIVAHSKGGLIGKYLLAENPELFKGMVAISTPFSGSKYAYFLPLPAIRTFLPNAPILALLQQNAQANKNIVSVYAAFDPHIPEGSFLEGAKNIKLPTHGHFRILKNRQVHTAVREALQELSKTP